MTTPTLFCPSFSLSLSLKRTRKQAHTPQQRNDEEKTRQKEKHSEKQPSESPKMTNREKQNTGITAPNNIKTNQTPQGVRDPKRELRLVIARRKTQTLTLLLLLSSFFIITLHDKKGWRGLVFRRRVAVHCVPPPSYSGGSKPLPLGSLVFTEGLALPPSPSFPLPENV